MLDFQQHNLYNFNELVPGQALRAEAYNAMCNSFIQAYNTQQGNLTVVSDAFDELEATVTTTVNTVQAKVDALDFNETLEQLTDALNTAVNNFYT